MVSQLSVVFCLLSSHFFAYNVIAKDAWTASAGIQLQLHT